MTTVYKLSIEMYINVYINACINIYIYIYIYIYNLGKKKTLRTDSKE